MVSAADSADQQQQRRDDEHADVEASRLVRSQSLETMGKLAAGVVHDMSNCLAAITGQLDQVQRALADGSASMEEIRQAVGIAALASADATQCVHRLLLSVRHAGEQEPEDRQQLHLEALLNDVVALTRPQWRGHEAAEEQRIEVALKPGTTPAILGSAAELRVALVNLVKNAVDALPHGGTITLATATETTAESTAYALVSVSDNGTGMDATTQRRLFDPLYTTKPPGKGTGMGMGMVQSTVDRHGGAIQVHSIPGQGTSIVLRFPACHQGSGDGALPAARALLRPLHILLVEDDATIRGVATRLLRRDGHRVTAVESGEAALSLLNSSAESTVCDALVTDIGLPGMSGWQLIEAVRTVSPALPIVVASGWGQSVTSIDLTRYGISLEQVVAKPYRGEVLRQALEAAIGGISM